ncbi:MAG: M23 family peptidase, partial [Paludibacteraceae bacterium]|nr:M23 family peptidase [Paludibacteraceae bacterium]
TRTLGDYKVLADTTAPAVTFLGKVGSVIKFRISDSQSGIGGWKATIDGKPAIFGYDAKSKILYYQFDPKRVEQGKNHDVEVSVSDKCGNTTKRKAKALW